MKVKYCRTCEFVYKWKKVSEDADDLFSCQMLNEVMDKSGRNNGIAYAATSDGGFGADFLIKNLDRFGCILHKEQGFYNE